jgi:transaldolase
MVAAQTDTRLWVNNPTREEAKAALDAGAVACTTNPTYAARMLRLPETREDALRIVDMAVAETPDDGEAAILVQRRLVAGIASGFKPHFQATAGREGFVSIQMDPRLDQDSAKTVAEALTDFALFPNCIAKIPVIRSGLVAIDCLVRLNKPVIATEIMAISQAIAACEAYRKASKESGHTPAFFVTHISGILDEQLKAEADALGVALSPEAVRLAGCSVAKKQYALMQERGLPGIQLGGGARGLHHFTEMVGGKAHVTLNWPGSIQTLEENPPAIESRMDKPVHESVIRELCAKLPTFARAYAEDGLKPDEFADFGPVVRFRTQFLNGWKELMEAIRERRAMVSATKNGVAHGPTGGSPAPSSIRGFCRVGENPSVEMRPGVFRSTLVYNTDQMLCHFHEKAGARVDLHTHVAVQSGYVLRGRVQFFDAAGKERVMGPGDAYLFNTNEPHGSVTLEETELLECFTPSRPEYLD